MKLKRVSKIHSRNVAKAGLVLCFISSLFYISWWFDLKNVSNPYLYSFLFLGEIYHVAIAMMFWFTVWPGDKKSPNFKSKNGRKLSVDIFITVAGEPVEVVEETAKSAKNINYPLKQIYLLNDGFVAKKDNWRDIERLASRLKINVITRKIPGGAKAGNINNALKQTKGDLIVIFDADMSAHPEFLEKTLPYFSDPKTGFVQTPQYYKTRNVNVVTKAAWEQLELFFGPIMIGKDKSNASFICGTNVVIRRKALLEAGGFNEDNIAEDFLTSLAIHQKGWISYYISEVLVEGLAPEDLLSYFKQQLRWARGSLEVLFSYNPLFSKNLTLSQKIEYLSSALYYSNGAIVFIDMLMPIIFLSSGLKPVATRTTDFAIFFIPFFICSLFTLFRVSDGAFTFRAISFGNSLFSVQLIALFSVIFKRKIGFEVTAKKAQQGNFINLVFPHILYMVVFIISIFFALNREGLNPSVATNIAWGTFNLLLFIPFIRAAYNFNKIFNLKPKLQLLSPQVET